MPSQGRACRAQEGAADALLGWGAKSPLPPPKYRISEAGAATSGAAADRNLSRCRALEIALACEQALALIPISDSASRDAKSCW
jgi:hypothetical protein